MLIILYLLLSFLLLGLVIITIIFGRGARDLPPIGRLSEEIEDIVVALGREESSLKARKRTLKVCPDCREFVLLEASTCKYCGCALTVEEKREPDLVLRRQPIIINSGEPKKWPNKAPEPTPTSVMSRADE